MTLQLHTDELHESLHDFSDLALFAIRVNGPHSPTASLTNPARVARRK